MLSVSVVAKWCAFWCNCIILVMTRKISTIAVFMYLYAERRNVWRRGRNHCSESSPIEWRSFDVNYRNRIVSIPRVLMRTSFLAISILRVSVAPSTTGSICVVSVDWELPPNALDVMFTIVVVITKWLLGVLIIRNSVEKESNPFLLYMMIKIICFM